MKGFFSDDKNTTGKKSGEETQEDTIKRLDHLMDLAKEDIHIGNVTTDAIGMQNEGLIETRDQLVKNDKGLNKAKKSMGNLEDSCACTLF